MSPGDPAATMDSLNDSITEKATESAPDIPLADARTESAENEANFMSKLMFQWISHFVILGYRRPLEADDIPLIDPERRTDRLVAECHRKLVANIERGDRFPLFWTLYETFKKAFWLGGVLRLTADVLLIATPFTLRYLIQFTMDAYQAGLKGEAGPSISHGVGYLIGISGMLTIQSLCHNHYMYTLGLIGGQCRAILSSAIFDKSLRIMGRATGPASKCSQEQAPHERSSHQHPQRHTLGHATHLLSVDVARVDKVTSAIHLLWTSPVALLLAVALLIANLRVSALAGLALMIVGFAGLIIAVGILFRQRKVIDGLTQARLSMTQEVLSAISLIKCFGWEEKIAKSICDERDKELRLLHHYLAVRNAVVALSQALPVLTAMVSFITYAMISTRLSAAVVFSSVALFTSMRMSLIYLPICIQGSLDGWASLSRIQDYLLTEEPEHHSIQPNLDCAAKIQQATFVWYQDEGDDRDESDPSSSAISLPTGDRTSAHFRLHHIDLCLHRGELLGVVGPVASGKSSLLAALAGDMTIVTGSVIWASSYAICPQKPWMHNATIRENITFGTAFDEEKYRATIDACSLTHDLSNIHHGDATMVGEGGVVLSGGQKQRISLARALYSGAEILLLDDPLSAIDTTVGRAILDNAICGRMGKLTRVLCTHDMDALSRCDRVLVMENGHIRSIGTYADLMMRDSGLVAAIENSRKEGREMDGHPDKTEITTSSENEAVNIQDRSMQEEDRQVRAVSWSVYGSLISSPGGLVLALICAPMLFAAQGCTVMTSLWLAWWSNDHFSMSRKTYIAIYAGLALSQMLFLYLFGLTLGLCCTRASQIMLNKAVLGVMKAPMSFFNTTPLGRHMNRFSSDVEAMDHALPEALRMHLISLAGLTAMIVLMIYYFHWFGIAVAVMLVVLITLALCYRASAREVKRHESIFRSTVFARFMEGLTGMSTLRAYNMQTTFSHALCSVIDDMSSAAFTTLALQRWLSLRQDAMTILLVIVMGILVIIERQKQNPAITGLVLSLMLNAVQVIQVVVREWADVESAMNSTERLHTYAHSLPEQPETSTKSAQGWPTRGEVIFLDLHMRYRPDLPEALRGINLHIEAGEKVAIVGRTGAGKSSIVNALFRLTECSGGSISIDGHDISKIQLQDLRGKALSIIPQDTTLFTGTVRSNIDPFNVASDARLWDAIRQVGLHDSMHLSDVIQDGGANLSLGQRQLLALARVLVRDTPVVVCDEATAALDKDTDDRIQQTMRMAFQKKTLLCIAHRLRTILWFDRICVLEMGRVIELGSPLELFKRETGAFRQMCLQLGINEQEIFDASQRL